MLPKPSPLAFCDEIDLLLGGTYGVDEVEIDSVKVHKGQIVHIPKENLIVEKGDKLVRLHHIFKPIKGIHNSTYSFILLISNWFEIP
jgi:hypothetical protein